MSVTPCNIFSTKVIPQAFEGIENDSRQMGPLTSIMSPCGTPVTTELFCHLCCHQIRLMQEVERRAFLNHRGEWLCGMCAFCERDQLYYFLDVEKGGMVKQFVNK